MRQVATLTAINAGDVEHANALLLLAQTMFDQKRHSDAEITGRRAIFLAESDIELQLRARVLRARSLLNLGRIADVRDEAALIDGSLLRLPTEPTAVRASAKRLHADLEMRENRFDDAVNLYNMAINESLAAEGSLSRLAIDIRLGLAYGFIVRNRADEARLPRESALSALRELGGGSEIRAALEESILARQAFVMQAMKFDEARNTIVRDREEIAGRGQPVPESILSEIEMNLGKVLYYWGNIQEGDRLVGLASARMRPSIDSLRERWEIVSWRGAIAMDAGRHLEADKLLREGLELRRAMGLGTQPFAAYDYAFVALNLAMMGHQNEGLAVLAAAPTFHAERGDPKFGSAYSESIVETRARLLLDAGAPAQALKWLTKLDEQIKPGQRVRVNDRRFIRGEALCATGANEDGLKILLDAIAAFESTSYPHEPQVARARAVAGHCALTSGHRLLGQRLAAQARTSFIAQPGVSPWYKAPLLKLERALGLRLQPV
jgi:tetratricopeptide (TPR) repeat protein